MKYEKHPITRLYIKHNMEVIFLLLILLCNLTFYLLFFWAETIGNFIVINLITF